MTFLIIEDDPIVADVLRAGAAGVGLRPVVAASLNEADLVLETVEVAGIALDLDLEGGGALGWLEGLHLLHPPFTERTLVVLPEGVGEDVRRRVAGCGSGTLPSTFTLSDFEDAFRQRLEAPTPPARQEPPAGPPRSPHEPADS